MGLNIVCEYAHNFPPVSRRILAPAPALVEPVNEKIDQQTQKRDEDQAADAAEHKPENQDKHPHGTSCNHITNPLGATTRAKRTPWLV